MAGSTCPSTAEDHLRLTETHREWNIQYDLRGIDGFSIWIQRKKRKCTRKPRPTTAAEAMDSTVCSPPPSAFAPVAASEVACTPQQAAVLQQLRTVLAGHEDELLVLQQCEQGFTDAALYRWLQAKGWDSPSAAAAAILQHAQWRRSLGDSGRVAEGQIAEELAAEKVFLQQDTDEQGHAVLTVLARRHDMHQRDLHQTTLLIAYALDSASDACTLHLNPLGRIVCLFDLSHVRLLSLCNLDVSGLKTIFEVLQRHYPERLAALWFINAPFLFWGLWNVVKAFVEPSTRQKLHFVSARPSRGPSTDLAQAIPSHVLPKEFGGTAALVPLQEAVALRRKAEAAATAELEAQAQKLSAQQPGDAPGRWASFRNALGHAATNATGPVRSLGNLLRRLHLPGARGGPPPAPLKHLSSLLSGQLAAPPLIRTASLRALQLVKVHLQDSLLFPVSALLKRPAAGSAWFAVFKVLDLARRVLRWTLGPL